LVGAIVVTGAAIWLVLVMRMTIAHWLVVGVALLVAVIWVAMFARARRRIAAPDRHALSLTPDAMVLIEGKREDRVEWGEIARIDVDEDRLMVKVEARGRDPLYVEPRYGGLGVTELERAIRSAYEAARG
jgi:membrane protein implicated in regulation of membrane protease activity